MWGETLFSFNFSAAFLRIFLNYRLFTAFAFAGCLPAEGCLPVERCLAKVAQIGSGKVFGSEGFVMKWIGRLGDKWRAKYTAAHRVGEIGYSTHGWRLAREGEAA